MSFSLFPLVQIPYHLSLPLSFTCPLPYCYSGVSYCKHNCTWVGHVPLYYFCLFCDRVWLKCAWLLTEICVDPLRLPPKSWDQDHHTSPLLLCAWVAGPWLSGSSSLFRWSIGSENGKVGLWQSRFGGKSFCFGTRSHVGHILILLPSPLKCGVLRCVLSAMPG